MFCFPYEKSSAEKFEDFVKKFENYVNDLRIWDKRTGSCVPILQSGRKTGFLGNLSFNFKKMPF